MRFLIDESADARLVAVLAQLGHDATFIARSHRPGLTDEEILEIGRLEGRILTTLTGSANSLL
jgi:predicted nuclease of predicted toxin-antitoxin system